MIRVMRISALFAVLVIGAGSLTAQSPAKLPVVAIETSLGAITVEIDSVRAPISAANFLRYVDAGAYNGGRFHRTVRADNQPNDSVKIDVIQGGTSPGPDRVRFPAIELERTSVTGLKHVDGAISMARAGPNSATSDFFLCIGANAALDFAGHRNLDGQGFAAFGRVLSGMDVVKAIQKSAAAAQSLTPPVVMTKVERRR